MAVLVTGATGFVGSHLVRELLRQGEDVRVLHRASSSMEDLEGLTFTSCLGDVTNFESLKAAAFGVDTVFHLAGVVAYSKERRAEMDLVNIGGTRNVVLATPLNAKIIYMSSVVTVGASLKPEILNENSPYTLRHLDLGYFESKRQAEKLVMEACLEGKARAVILNPSTIYGSADAKKGSRKLQLKVAQGKFPLYSSGGASVVSVHDIVDAILKARTKGRIGERYILSGENLTIHELFKRIAELAGTKPPSWHVPNFVMQALGAYGNLLEKIGKKGPLNSESASTSTMYHWFDHSKATRELDFHPRPAQEALSESVGWMKEHGLLK